MLGRLWLLVTFYAANIYLFKVNNEDNKWRQQSRSGVFVLKFEHISQLFLAFLLLTLIRLLVQIVVLNVLLNVRLSSWCLYG